MACTEGDDGKVNELLEAGADPNVKVRPPQDGCRWRGGRHSPRQRVGMAVLGILGWPPPQPSAVLPGLPTTPALPQDMDGRTPMELAAKEEVKELLRKVTIRGCVGSWVHW